METKQTAVEWLYDQIIILPETNDDLSHNVRSFKQAKAMEKEQIELAFNESRKIQDSDEISITHDWNNSEQYYKLTYGIKETAVNWLLRMLYSPVCNGFINGKRQIPHDIIQQAKAIEKKQIINDYCKGVNDYEKHNLGAIINYEEYYNETYGK